MANPPEERVLIPIERIERSILVIRGYRVMLDSDLAALYGVETRVLVQAVKRNWDRFPRDFMFQLTKEEFDNLRSQTVISKQWGGRRYPPYAFTEHGAVMLASVLNTPIAIRASIYVVRAFVQLREVLTTHKELAQKLTELEHKIEKHDESIRSILEAIRRLMTPPKEQRRPIGFHSEEEDRNKK